MTRDEALRLLRRPIAFHRIFVTISGSVNAGLMLSQAWYWKDHTNDNDGWFWKTRDEWEAETGLGRTEQENARRVLKERGFMQEALRGMPAKTHFRVDVENVLTAINGDVSSWQETRQQAGRKPANKLAGNPPTVSRKETGHQDGGKPANMSAGNQPTIPFTETTSETTSTHTARARSKFDLATCERFARTLLGVRYPDAYARTIFRSGDDDEKIAAWLERARTLAAPGLDGVIARAAAAEGRPVEEVAEEFRAVAKEIQR